MKKKLYLTITAIFALLIFGTAIADNEVPTDSEKLHEWLKSGAYENFEASESKAHPSAGPHTKYGLPVRVFLNPVLNDSLQAQNKQHPVGSAAVKEMYNVDNELEGWAVMVKTQAESDNGKGWFWYEVTSTEDASNPVAAENGVPLCFSCHGGGKDFVLSNFPLQ